MNYPDDARQFAPATQRNRQPILEVLTRVLPPQGTVLEIASGTGEHAVFFSSQLAPRQWLPSDINPTALESIAAWREHASVTNLYPPIQLDVSRPEWFLQHDLVAIVNINMIHISPWESCLGLMAGARRILGSGGILYLYGPYKRQGEHTAPSNAAFDQMLRSQNPEWGVRNLEDVVAVAKENSLELQEVIEMPANNLSVVFRRN